MCKIPPPPPDVAAPHFVQIAQIADLKKIVSYLQGVQTSYGEGTEEYSKDQLGDFQRDTFYEF